MKFHSVVSIFILRIYWYPSEMLTETPTVTTDQPPTVPTMAIEVVNVVMNNMENYLPTDVVEQDDDARYVCDR